VTVPTSVPTVPTLGGYEKTPGLYGVCSPVPTVPTYFIYIYNRGYRATVSQSAEKIGALGRNGSVKAIQAIKIITEKAVPTPLFLPKTVPTSKMEAKRMSDRRIGQSNAQFLGHLANGMSVDELRAKAKTDWPDLNTAYAREWIKFGGHK
jgi:hypothetical protein